MWIANFDDAEDDICGLLAIFVLALGIVSVHFFVLMVVFVVCRKLAGGRAFFVDYNNRDRQIDTKYCVFSVRLEWQYFL